MQLHIVSCSTYEKANAVQGAGGINQVAQEELKSAKNTLASMQMWVGHSISMSVVHDKAKFRSIDNDDDVD